MNRKEPQKEVEKVDKWNELKGRVQVELDQRRREVKEIAMMIEQSQAEVNKLAQRNASITAHLQQIQGLFDTLPRADIRMAYDSALDAQQRLFVMRGQLEKLQSDRSHMAEYIAILEAVLQAFEGGMPVEAGSRSGGTTPRTVEMMIQAQESERQRLSRQMHDGPAQALSNFILQTEIAMRLFDLDQGKARSELENLKISASSTFRKVRDFIFELRPMMLDDLGLVPTIKRYVDAFKDQSGIDIRFLLTGKERRLAGYEEVMIFRAIQELLHNSSRHSGASTVKVQLDMGDPEIKVQVDDDGKGFPTDRLEEGTGMGLKVIRDRVELLGGRMDVDSTVGKGTHIQLQVPALEVAAPTGTDRTPPV
jgi:two-component system, NarL family, sensor histidine kinase DegS